MSPSLDPLQSSNATTTTDSESILDSVTISTNSEGVFANYSTNVTSAANSLTSFLLQLNLTQSQRSKFIGIAPQGIKCYLHHWLQLSRNPSEGLYCDVAWDEIYCWPPTRAGENVSRPCSEVMKDDPEIPHPEDIIGSAFRICREDGTWEWNGWTNYNQCIEALEDPAFVAAPGPDLVLVNAVTYIFFVGSVLSFACILISLFIFFYFKSLRCDRITVQIHLMISLLFRFILMIIITEPFIFQRTTHYRTVDWICKTVMALQLYATVASISWMFVQGHYLHSRVTTNVFDRGTPFRAYFGIGWGIPLLLILVWVWVMEVHHEAYCWKNYGKSEYIWIIVGPMVIALLVNLLFLINIMRILLTKIQLASISSDSTQFRRAVKATVVLFPLLGANNLLFLYNPGGEYEAAYMLTNAVFQASQGIVVATLYCFISKEVREAIRREYRRYSVQRSAAAGVSSNGLSIVASMKDRRRIGQRSKSYYGKQTSNSVYCCAPTGDNAAHRHSFHRSTSSFFHGTRTKNSKPITGSGNNSIRSISGSKQGLALVHLRINGDDVRENGHQLLSGHITKTASAETTSFLRPK